jgi:hypothetical protein
MFGIPLTQRIYFAVIGLAALLVAVLGWFFPAGLADIFPWATVPPLHARFIGAMYGFGAVFLFSCAIARKPEAVRWAVLMTVIWTGMLGIISSLRLNHFDLSRLPDQIWLASYTVYPLLGLLLLFWQHPWKNLIRAQSIPTPFWIERVLQVQGILVTVLALLLLLFPLWMSNQWPWKVTPLLAQMYAGPLLAYGVGSLLVARETFSTLFTIIPAMLIFTVGTLIASVLHRNLLAFEVPDLVWFGFFIVMTILLLGIYVDMFRSRGNDRQLFEKVLI